MSLWGTWNWPHRNSEMRLLLSWGGLSKDLFNSELYSERVWWFYKWTVGRSRIRSEYFPLLFSLWCSTQEEVVASDTLLQEIFCVWGEGAGQHRRGSWEVKQQLNCDQVVLSQGPLPCEVWKSSRKLSELERTWRVLHFFCPLYFYQMTLNKKIVFYLWPLTGHKDNPFNTFVLKKK